MPWLGFGVWQIEDPKVLNFAVKTALKAGYVSIDTAEAYRNEKDVGIAIKESGIPREKLFITTKLWNARQREGYDAVLKAFEASRERLGLEYIDLFLIHWPIKGKYIEAWKAMIKLYREGVIRAIGVSNFHTYMLQELMEKTDVVPAVNQVELHPWLNQEPLVRFCRENGIQVEAYSPLMNGHIGEVRELSGIAAKYGKTPAQVVLRWDLQRGIVVIPKSVHEHRIIENADIFDFELSEEDMEAIMSLNRNKRFLPDPEHVYF
jgi:diketogulonate reductase-like aldo/keto reductase